MSMLTLCFIIIKWLKSVRARWISASESIFLSFSCHDDVSVRVWRAPLYLSPSLWFCHWVHWLSQRTPPELNRLRGRLRCGGGIKFSTSSHFTFDLLEKKLLNIFLVTKDTTGSSSFQPTHFPPIICHHFMARQMKKDSEEELNPTCSWVTSHYHVNIKCWGLLFSPFSTRLLTFHSRDMGILQVLKNLAKRNGMSFIPVLPLDSGTFPLVHTWKYENKCTLVLIH